VFTATVFTRLPTDPASNDTDGDGLQDRREACLHGTDPLLQDTDGDNLTDYEEVYTYTKTATMSAIVNKTQSYTWNVTVDALGWYSWTVNRTDDAAPNPFNVSLALDGQTRYRGDFSTDGQRSVAFAAVLYKGLHSLVVQWAGGTGRTTVQLISVLRDETRTTTPWLNDTDGDGLPDGDEVRGLAGWALDPRDPDSDGDGAEDGLEVNQLHSDPTLRDTDGDTYADGIDLDPLHDLVVQARVVDFIAHDTATGYSYWGRPQVQGNWSESASAPKEQVKTVYHNLSVNVRDDTRHATVVFRVMKNTSPYSEVDIKPGAGTSLSVTFDLLGADTLGATSSGSPTDPWGVITYDIRTLRLGKANTLLATPGDWSGVFNGSTGLHRYQGEQRFAFVLLNVTDGYGNVTATDFETTLGSSRLADLGPQGMTLNLLGSPKSVPGMLQGKAYQFDGTDDRVSGNAADASKLDLITTGLTISLLFRPDRDYVSESGSAFHAFAERSLDDGNFVWRFGWSAATDGLELALKPTSGSVVTLSTAAYPLHQGTWYRLTATYGGGYLRIYVDGAQVGSPLASSITIASGGTWANAVLRVGVDTTGSDTYLKGTLDDFGLWKEGKSADAVRAMAVFRHGTNAIVVPRGLLYESKLNQTLYTGTSPVNANPALKKITVHANQNGVTGTATAVDAYLNARVIQQVMEGNVTLAEAQWFADQLAVNRTGNVTSFLLDVTEEFYTVGFAPEVIALSPNATAANSGNTTPPATGWQLLFNVIVSLAGRAWNTAVAVGEFMRHVADWLKDAVVGLAIGLLTGNWTLFQDKVVKPFVEAMAKLIQWIVDLVTAALDTLLGPLLDWIQDGLDSVAIRTFSPLSKAWLEYVQTGGASEALARTVALELISPFTPLILALEIASTILDLLLLPFMALESLIGMVVGLLLGLFLSQVFTVLLAVNPPAGFLLAALISLAIDLVDPPEPLNPWGFFRLFLPWIIFTIATLLTGSRTISYWFSLLIGGFSILLGFTRVALMGVGADQGQINQYTRLLLLMGVLGAMSTIISLALSLTSWANDPDTKDALKKMKLQKVKIKLSPPRGTYWKAFALGIAFAGIWFNWDYLSKHP